MDTFDIRIPYVEIRDETTRELIGIIEGAEIFFEYNFHESGTFEIYCRATDQCIELLKKDRYVTLPINADSVDHLIEQDSNIWVIQKIQKTNDATGGRWIIASGKEAKQIVDKRIIRNTAKLDKNDISTEVRTKLFEPNLLKPSDAKRLINGFVFTENMVGVNITQDTQVTYDNLFTYTEELYKAYGVGAKLRFNRDTKQMIYTIYKGDDRSNEIVFSQGNDNLINSDYTEDWAEYKTSALVGGEEKEEERYETNPTTGETIRTYKVTKRTLTMVEDGSADINRREVFVDARDLQSSYEEEVGSLTITHEYDIEDEYKPMLQARGKEKLASENNVIREFNGEIDTVNNKKTFNIDYYLGDKVKIRDDDIHQEIVVRISKFVKVQNSEGYKEYFEYEEMVEAPEVEVNGALLTEYNESILTEDNNVIVVESVNYATRSVSPSVASVSGVKISELAEATNVTDGCCLPIVSQYETKKITYGALKERLSNDLEISGDSYDDTELKGLINDLQSNKADKADLEAKADKSEIPDISGKADLTNDTQAITAGNLTSKTATVTEKLDVTGTLTVNGENVLTTSDLVEAGGYDDTEVRELINDLQTGKADLTNDQQEITANKIILNSHPDGEATHLYKTVLQFTGGSSEIEFDPNGMIYSNNDLTIGAFRKIALHSNYTMTLNDEPVVTKASLLDYIYPVGSLYMSVNRVSPASFLGGTWEQLPIGYALWTANSDAGTTIAPGLPNITGQIGNALSDQAIGRASGAFTTWASAVGFKGSNDYKWSSFDFNANRSSWIYGNSTTVQPPAYKVYAWKRVE